MYNMPTQLTCPVSGECSTYGLAISDGSGKADELIIFKHLVYLALCIGAL